MNISLYKKKCCGPADQASDLLISVGHVSEFPTRLENEKIW